MDLVESARMPELVHRHTVYIRCKPVELWAALTEGEQTRKWYLNATVESTFEPGAPIRYLADRQDNEGSAPVDPTRGPERVEAIRGHIRAVEPERRLAHGFSFSDLDERETYVEWTIHPLPGVPVLRVDLVHDGFLEPGQAWERTREGWPMILSALKTWLETHDPLVLSAAPQPAVD